MRDTACYREREEERGSGEEKEKEEDAGLVSATARRSRVKEKGEWMGEEVMAVAVVEASSQVVVAPASVALMIKVDADDDI